MDDRVKVEEAIEAIDFIQPEWPDSTRIEAELTVGTWRTILAALRASDTGRSEAEASKPAEGVRPPGETLWLAHGAMFGSKIADWDSLGLADKLRWASVEDAAMRNLLAQSNAAAIHPPAGQGERT